MTKIVILNWNQASMRRKGCVQHECNPSNMGGTESHSG
jgi:hypothetical protein